MSAHTDLRAMLVADAGITALVGSGASARIRADRAEQTDARPFIVFGRTGGRIERGLDGTVLGSLTEFTLNFVADTRAGAEALRDAALAVFDANQIDAQPVEDPADLPADIEMASLQVSWWT